MADPAMVGLTAGMRAALPWLAGSQGSKDLTTALGEMH
jgi:hypothetical protein